MLLRMKRAKAFTPPPDFVTAFLGNHGIAEKDGTYDFLWKNKGFGSIYRVVPENPYKVYDPKTDKLLKQKCLTLDSWLGKYKEQGFLEKIDLMYICASCDVPPILHAFSFSVKPKRIVMKIPYALNAKDLQEFEKHGYTVWHKRLPILLEQE